MFQLNFNLAATGKLETVDLESFVKDWSREVADQLNRAKKLSKPWKADSAGKGRARIATESPGLPFLITGTKPHQIVGHPVLHFIVQGQDVFAKSVNHPGTKPSQKLLDVLAGIADTGESILDRMVP